MFSTKINLKFLILFTGLLLTQVQRFSAKEIFKGLNLYYNQQVPINSEQNILIGLESLGNTETTIELYTSTYLIASFSFPNEGRSKKFQKSTDLPELCKKLMITNSLNQPPKQGYYIAVLSTFVNLGDLEVTLIASDAMTQDEYFRKNYRITTILQSTCYPKIRLAECVSPQNPRKMLINRRNIVDAIVERSCGTNSILKYSWSIRNYLDTETKHSFQEAKSRTLRIPAYSFWFNDELSLFHLMYVIKLKVEETLANGSSQGLAMTRCYVLVVLQPPIANIEYGNIRKTNVYKKVTVDAFESRDLSSPKVGMNLKYQWSCHTDDTANRFCKENMGHEKTVTIPANKLSINKKYNFTVKITSTRSSLFTTAWQEITPTTTDHLSISYQCVRNCFNRIANNQGIIHMQAICKDCKRKKVSYIWSIIKPVKRQIGTGIRLITNASELPKGDVITVELKVQQEQSGVLIFDLTMAEPPKKGSCSVQPKEGKEYITEFSLNCKEFSSAFEPLLYSLHQGDQLLGSQANGDFKLKLSQSEDSGSANLKLTVTDAVYGYSTYDISIPLAAINIPATYDGILTFITKETEVPSLQKSIDSGDITTIVAAMRITGKIVGKLNNEKTKLRLIEEILKILHSIDLTTTQSIEKLSLGLHSLLAGINPDHNISVLTGQIFEIIINALERSTKSKEIFDIDISGCYKMSQALAETAGKMFIQVDQFPMVHDVLIPMPEDSYNENYPDYGEMNFEVIEKIHNWQHGAKSIRRLFEMLGATAFQLIEPKEEGIKFNIIGSTSWTFKVFGPEYFRHTNEASMSCLVSIPPSVTQSLMKQDDLKSKVGIQSIFFENNPFWWYPEENKINSRVVQINVFSQLKRESNYLVSEIEHSFDLFLSLSDRVSTEPSYETKGYVTNQLDMPIYQCIVPKKSFFEVEFISTEEEIRVLTSTGDPPKYRQILENYHLVATSSTPYRIQTDNKKNYDTIGYVAILPHRKNSSSKINFIFKSTVYSCNIWDPFASHWTLNHCRVANRTNSTHIQCRCNHFSMFAAKLFKTPNRLELPRDIILVLRTNVPFLIMFLLILLLFVALLSWASHKDKKNRAKPEIYTINKYDPEKTYMYLATITTGSHQYAGTTATIAIQLLGCNLTSEKYVLLPRHFDKVFERKSEHTFALPTHDHLGDLEAIIITNDYSGRYPSWYCDIVRIKDTIRCEEFIFIVRQWLSLVYGKTVEVTVCTASEKDLFSNKFLIYRHFSRAFSEMYLWYSLFWTHPRSPLSRKEKTLVLLTGLCFGAMLSILFFGRTTVDNVEDEQRKYMKYVLAFRNILHTILCTIVGVFVAKVIVKFLNYSKANKTNDYKLVYGK